MKNFQNYIHVILRKKTTKKKTAEVLAYRAKAHEIFFSFVRVMALYISKLCEISFFFCFFFLLLF